MKQTADPKKKDKLDNANDLINQIQKTIFEIYNEKKWYVDRGHECDSKRSLQSVTEKAKNILNKINYYNNTTS